MQSVGPMYFNERLGEKIENLTFVEDVRNSPFDEGKELKLTINAWGAPTSMSVYQFLVNGEGIACFLKCRVRELQFLTDLHQDFLSNVTEAKALLDQFDRFIKSKEKADRVVAELTESLKEFDKTATISGKHLVTDYKSAQKVIANLAQLSSKIQKGYLTGGTVNTYLADRVNKLRLAYDNFNPALQSVAFPCENDSGEEL